MFNPFNEIVHPGGLCLQHSITLAVAIRDKFEDTLPKEFNNSEVRATLITRLNTEIEIIADNNVPIFSCKDCLALQVFSELNVAPIGTEFLFRRMCNGVGYDSRHCGAVMAVVGMIVCAVRHGVRGV